jgi:hypothetical protein
METFFTHSIPMSLGFGQISSSQWSSVKKYLCGLESRQLEEYANQFSYQLVDNPYSALFLVLGLPKWKYA